MPLAAPETTTALRQLPVSDRPLDYIPVLVYRHTHEELVRAKREELHRAA